MTDPLTGLFSRGFLESMIIKELARCRRQGVMASLLLVDLDNFAATNSRYGRDVGDAALRAATDVIRGTLRAADLPCRYDGDEFGVVLPSTYRSGALLVGERIVSEIRRQFSARAVAGSRIAVTASVGVAWYATTCDTPAALLHAAACALAEAKAAGGDRVAPQA